MQLYIGTSGWVYPHWRRQFYPDDLAESDWLAFYARHFDSVELNRSFYRLPTADNIAEWCDRTPDNFRFAVKASRYITHMKKLREPDKTLPALLDCIQGLDEKLGPVLFQLPPRWRSNPDRLQDFLRALPADLRVAVELRDASWHNEDITEILRDCNAAFCIYDIGGLTSPRRVTADFIYLRLHGPGKPYTGCYDSAALNDWAQWLRQQSVRQAYVYFDNDDSGYAVRNALEFKRLMT